MLDRANFNYTQTARPSTALAQARFNRESAALAAKLAEIEPCMDIDPNVYSELFQDKKTAKLFQQRVELLLKYRNAINEHDEEYGERSVLNL
jgi:hypothetical protein